MDKAVPVTLEHLAGGAASDLFNHEMDRVLNNINDINTKAEAVREITIKLKIVPNDDRSYCHAEVAVTSKLAPVRPHKASMHISTHLGQLIATEYNPKQEKLFQQEEINLAK